MASSGNFAVFSTVTRPESGYSTSDQITGGGLSIKSPSSGSFEPCIATISPNSGKWYWEYRAGQGGGSTYGRPAIATSEQTVVKNEDLSGGQSGQVGVLFLANDGQKRINGSSTSYGNAVSQHDIVQVALDCDNGAVYFGINNTWQNSGDPTSGSSKTGAALTTGIQNVDIDILHTRYAGGGIDQYNFGQDDTFGGAITAAGNADGNGHGVFKYSPPTGFLALCSANLSISDNIDPAQTDDNYPGKQFGVAAYSGNSGTQSIDLGFKPDLIWTKIRVASDSRIVDSTRGTDSYLVSNTSAAASTVSTGVTAFTTTGYNLGSDGIYNGSSYNYVSWCWRANGGTTSSNSDGDITSTVQANQEAGFSIMKWTGNGSSNQTIGHGLGAVPDIWMVKNIDSSGDWRVGLNTTAGAAFDSLSGSNDALKLNGSDGTAQMWRPEGNFTATSTTCNTPNNGNSAAFFTTSGDDFIGYCWKGIEGFSKFGTYIGNGDSDGPFIYTGFRPAMYFVKIITATNGWFTYDKLREGYNDENDTLSWQSNAGDDDTYIHEILSNGFKIKDSNNATNQSGQTFIYGAWADVPFKYNNTR